LIGDPCFPQPSLLIQHYLAACLSLLDFDKSFVLIYLVSFGNGRGKFISNSILPLCDRGGIRSVPAAADEQPDPYPFFCPCL
jgi:hypothetical protein